MEKLLRWTISDESGEHAVEYYGLKLSGYVSLSVDGAKNLYVPTMIKGVGLFVSLKIGVKDALLRISPDEKNIDLAVDGRYLDSQRTLEVEQEEIPYSSTASAQEALQKKLRSKRSSFLTMIVLTFVNIFLIIINASISFPFSAFVPTVAASFGYYAFRDTGSTLAYSAGLAVALISASVYVLLYLLSGKRKSLMILAMVFFCIDSAVLLLFSVISQDIGTVYIDILFHAWVIWGMVGMIRTKSQLDALVKKDMSAMEESQRPHEEKPNDTLE